MKKQVAAAIIEIDGKFLIARREKQDSLKGLWEFPGGKVEEGESLDQCLVRELNEELGICAQVGSRICEVDFINPKNNISMQMIAFKVVNFSGNITLYEHEKICWVAAKDLLNYEFPSPDYSIIDTLIGQQDK